MTKQSQPKVSEMIEVLIQQQIRSDETNAKINNGVNSLIDIIENRKLKVDVSELRSIVKNSNEKRNSDFEIFHRETKNNYKQLLNAHKIISSKTMLYIILFNVLLLLVTGLSMYVAINNSVEKSEFELLIKEQKELKVQLENVDTFFTENPKTFTNYKEWYKNQ